MMTLKQQHKNILITLAIVAPFLVTVLFVRLFVDLESLERVNKGSMILPHVQLPALNAATSEGAPLTRDTTSGHWSLMYIAGGDCDDTCKNALYYLIQNLRLSLGKDSGRLARMVVHSAEPGAELREFLDTNVSGMGEYHASVDNLLSAFNGVFPPGDSPVGKIFVVSPDGQIILWYPSHADRQQVLLEADNILADLKRILKGSVNG